MKKAALLLFVSACVPVTTQLRPPTSWQAGDSPIVAGPTDLNGDGKLDLVVSKAISIASSALLAPAEGEITVLLGRGDGTFTQGFNLAGRGTATGSAVVDLTGDGRPEIVVIGLPAAGAATILINNGDGTFRQGPVTTFGATAVWPLPVDLNGDGKNDLVGYDPRPATTSASDFIGGRMVVALGHGDGTFEAPRSRAIGRSVSGLGVGDLNGDGKPDLVLADDLMSRVYVLFGRGDGNFDDGEPIDTPLRPAGVLTTDLNRDHHPDLVVGTVDGFMAFLNRGNATFESCGSTYTEPSRALVVADFNRDGNPDVITGRRLLLGDGACHFTGSRLPDAEYNDSLVIPADFNGDGWLDVVAADRAHNSVHVYLNAGGVPVKTAKR